jgi:hypothetical protein
VHALCRAFDSTDKGAVDFHEFYQLHLFIMMTQRSFQERVTDGSSRMPHSDVSHTLQQAGGPCCSCASSVNAPVTDQPQQSMKGTAALLYHDATTAAMFS